MSFETPSSTARKKIIIPTLRHVHLNVILLLSRGQGIGEEEENLIKSIKEVLPKHYHSIHMHASISFPAYRDNT